MAGRARGVNRFCIVAVTSALAAGCAQTPMGPMVQVIPGPGRSFETFQADQAACKDYAANQVRGQAEAANNQAVGAALLTTAVGAGLGAVGGSLGGQVGQGVGVGAAAGAAAGTAIGAASSQNAQVGIQAQYDAAFSQCMYAKGDQVPGYAPQASSTSGGGGGADPTVRSAQRELIRLGYLNDTADGVAGPKTFAAVRQFQKANGMPADGTISPALVAKLQATPGNHAAAAAPSTTAAAPATPSNWVAPTTGAPAAATAPASAWVKPATPQ